MEPYELKRGRFKNLTLRLLPPDGRLRVTAPWFMPRFAIDAFVTEREAWIAARRLTLASVPKPVSPPEDRVWVWGREYRLTVESPGRLPRVVVGEDGVVVRVPASWTADQRRRLLDRWEADRVREALGLLLPLWTAKTGLAVSRWTVKKLRSRWGSCRPDTRSLVFNSRLGALGPECLEHVIVHELMHLLEPRHNARFHALVEGWLPGSDAVRRKLRTGTGPAASGELDASPTLPSRPGAETGP